ncbi:MAG TPA: ATP-binding cassette domain-containing protein [Acidimicrobiales bacterium]|nr:ATP-binding cassette domain-containing protein [Acidimicrobiales bacterium]
MPEGSTRTKGALRPIELATASVLGTLAVVLTVAGWFLPHLGIVAAFAVVPLGVVAHHHRLRALIAGAFAAAVLSFLVAGTGTVTNIVECAAVGGLVGIVKRRGWGIGAVAAGVAVIGPVLAAISVGLLAVFDSLRQLTLEQIRNTWKGISRLLSGIPALSGVLNRVNDFVTAAINHWWITVAVLVIGATVWFAILGWVFIGAVLDRLQWIRAQDRLDLDLDRRPPGPLPVALADVDYRYPGAEADAVKGVSLAVGPAEMVALVGDNGSGKSTVTRLLAGRPPTGGRVERPGPAGLGRPGGTAMILQHPETQVLGVRVADDVVWGLPGGQDVDIAGILRSVGLGGMDDRETSALSGGELQRLAVAAALARHPRLLLSDESTAMVDEAGRRELTGLLRQLPDAHGISVVHVTHRPEEAALADRGYRLEAGTVVAEGPGPVIAAQQSAPAVPGPGLAGLGIASVGSARPAVLELTGVTHTYGVGTPWARTALHDVDLSVRPHEGVLIVGGNGSGKSTLAWIMAGLLRPTFGGCLLGGEPVRGQIGAVALAFQHARLQLQRATVARDVRAAGAPDEAAVAGALTAVGLDPEEMGERRIDTLSGGQQRRVALAGLLSRRPSVLVLDEPMAGLDARSRDGLVDLLAGLRHRHGLTVVVISHDLGGMEKVCDRVVRLGDGCIVDDSTVAAAGI